MFSGGSQKGTLAQYGLSYMIFIQKVTKLEKSYENILIRYKLPPRHYVIARKRLFQYLFGRQLILNIFHTLF